ncbi:LTA synthase family protein [Thalassotalea euphylliae]|uniref:Alkaline phosphatase family protein n=1 Tax=Thalassotalea euphylliae TaxID=1655234 RepID=A0A3E0U4N5_9GAMM|nr:alkaline phosphatase family protein [Thalassotalea euphylliae]REL31918.1 alkaline phosphatase family protein [Thalassotalea euphylliae]
MQINRIPLFIYFLFLSCNAWILETILFTHDEFGRVDSLSFAVSCMVVSYVLYNIFKQWSAFILSLLIASSLLFTFTSYKFFQFFGGYIGYEQIFLFKDLVSAADKFSLIPALALLVYFLCISMIGWRVLAHANLKTAKMKFTRKWLPPVAFTVCALALFSAHNIRYEHKTHWVNKQSTYDYSTESPVMFMLRSLPISQQYLNHSAFKEKADLQVLAKALANNIPVEVPDGYHYERFSSLLLDYPGLEHKQDISHPLLYVPNTTQSQRLSSAKPNVILIVLESFRAYETSLFNSDIKLTPNLDEIANHAIVAPNFYSNSRTTVQAEQAILCSAIDFASKSPYSVIKGEFNGVCLPEILSKNDYQTFWYHGFTKTFFNREKFHPSIGFQHVIAKEEFISQGYDENLDIGWGIPDTYSFNKMLDDMIEFNSSNQKPFFTQILTLTNHQPFNWNYKNVNFPKLTQFKDSVYNEYQRGIYYTDYALGKFWQKFNNSPLKDNTILVITADHGVPFYPDNIDTELSRHNVLYRVPLLVVTPERNSEIIGIDLSHLDIAPTILSMLNISEQVSFIGRPFLGTYKTLSPRPIFTMNVNNYGFKYNNLECLPNVKICEQDNLYCRQINQHYCASETPEEFNLFEQSENFMRYLELAVESGYAQHLPIKKG